MSYLAAYLGALVVFGALDAIWLGTMGAALYRSVLGDLLASTVRIVPAIAFYLVYPVGIVVFAAMPGLKAGSVMTAVGLGLLFGAIAYATYDLTNHATLRTWALHITLIDIVYGGIVSGLAAGAAVYCARLVGNGIG